MLLDLAETTHALGRHAPEPATQRPDRIEAIDPSASPRAPLKPGDTDYRPEAADLGELRPTERAALDNLATLAPLERLRMHALEISSVLQVLQSWEGAVTDIDIEAGTFTVRLHDLTDPNAPLSEAVLDIADVSNNDRDLLREGGVFRWIIGYRRHNFGQMDRVSTIIFRRLPAWHEEDLEAASRQGEALASAFSAD